MKRMMLFLMMYYLIGLAQADLAVTNGDFETGGGENIEDVTDWYEYNTGNFWEGAWQTNASWITPNSSNVVVFSSFESDDFGAPSTNSNDGSYLYQSIGTAGGLTSVQISFDWGAPNDDPGSRDLGLTVGIYAHDGSGGFTAADGTDVRGASGVTLLDSESFEYTTAGTDGEIFSASAVLNLSGAGSQELFLRFNGYNASSTESWPLVDNVQLLTLDSANQPDPDNGETDVAVDLSDRTIANNLSWTAPSDPNISEIKGYDIFLDPNETKVSNGDLGCLIATSTAAGVTQYDPVSNFANDQTYYWVVDTRYTRDDDPNLGMPTETIYVGSPAAPWSFSTITANPVIVSSPVNARAFVTDPNALFICEFTSTSAATAEWYKNGTPTPLSTGGDIVINTTNDGSGNYTSTLEILTPALADEGDYYCTADNGAIPATSDSASLIIKRLLAQYDFDGSLAPAVGSAADAPTGTALDTQGDPNSLLAVPASTVGLYTTGVNGIGQAVVLDPNEYVDFGVEGYPKANAVITTGYGSGLDEGTIIFWVKPNVDVQQVILANLNDGGTTGLITLLQADQDLDLYIRGAGGTVLAEHPAGQPDRPEYNLSDGNWHMMAACWGGNAATLYVDGQWVTAGTSGTPASYDAWQRGTLLGAARTPVARDILSDMFAGGAIDNLRIYNYRKDETGVDAFAQEYLDNTGVQPCIDMTFDGDAYNFDNTGSSYCKVDLADFALFVEAWLANGLY